MTPKRLFNTKEDLKARKEELKELREVQQNRREQYEQDFRNNAAFVKDKVIGGVNYNPPSVDEGTSLFGSRGPRPEILPMARPVPEEGAKGFARMVGELPSARMAASPVGVPRTSTSQVKKEEKKSSILPWALAGGGAALAFPETFGSIVNGIGSLTGLGGATAASAASSPLATVGMSTLEGGTALVPEITPAMVGAPEAAGAFDLAGIGGAGNVLLPAIGAAFALDHLGDFGGQRDDPLKGGLRGAAEGAAIASYFGMPWLGAGIGGAIGVAGSFIKSGKHKDQMERDKVRGGLKEAGLIDPDYNVELADGSKYNIGPDGGAKLPNGLRPYELDLNDPLVQELIPYAKSFIAQFGWDEKKTNDMVGYYVNAALSNAGGDLAKAKANISHQFGKAQATLSQSIANLDKQLAEGKITQQERDVLVAKANEIAPPDIPEGGGAGGFPGINVNYNFPAQEKQPIPSPDLSGLMSKGVPRATPPQNFLQGAAQSFGGLVNQIPQ